MDSIFSFSSFIVRVVLSLFNIKLRNFMCILNEFFAICEVYAHVTKHSVQCPSPAGTNQVSSGASIDFIEMYAYEKCSLFIWSRVASNSKVVRKKRINLMKV